MKTKLHINISQGIIDVKGDAELVKEIYSDFKSKLLTSQKTEPTVISPQQLDEEVLPQKPASKRRVRTKQKNISDGNKNGRDPKKPVLDKSLDTSTLSDFYGNYEPKNNAEKILLFAKFMTEKLQIEKPNTDQFFTCFLALKETIPKAFAQTFIDTAGKSYGYIHYNSPDDIEVSILGTNHFNQGLKRKVDE